MICGDDPSRTAVFRSLFHLDKNLFQEMHTKYNRMVEEVKSMQAKCMKGIENQRYRFRSLTDTLHK